MRHHDSPGWAHDHTFGLDRRQPGESRALVVIALTAVTMVVEIIAGSVYGSMALLADGLHMASHVAALGITAVAYRYARKHAGDRNYSFGTGKVNTLGGYTGAILLAVFAALMVWESLWRLVEPVAIAFDQAIVVAVIGLLVNGGSVLILDTGHGHDHHHHDHDHDHDPGHSHGQHQGHAHPHPHDKAHADHNLRSAYLHVIADALTSLLAIVALLAGKFANLPWMDPLMGVLGALLVARWSWGLLQSTATILLDSEVTDGIQAVIRQRLEADGQTRLVDLHVWSLGSGKRAAIVSLTSPAPLDTRAYHAMIPASLGLDHVTIEVHTLPS